MRFFGPILAFSLAFHLQAFAAVSDKSGASQTEKTLEVFRQYLDAEPMRSSMIRLELDRLKPDVQIFVDHALRTILEDEIADKPYPERRRFYLIRLGAIINRSLPWENFEGSERKRSIHKSAQELLEIFATQNATETELLSIFDQLQLWDQSDLPFIFSKVFTENGNQNDAFAERLVALAPLASDNHKAALAREVRKKHKTLMGSALLFKMGFREPKDMLWLVVRLMEWQAARVTSFTESRPVPAHILAVAHDLHVLLHRGDRVALEAFNLVRKSRGRNGHDLSEAELSAGQQFLRDLWSGHLFENCEQRLRVINLDQR